MHSYPRFLLVTVLWIALSQTHARSQGFHDLGVELIVSPEAISSGQPFTATLVVTNGGSDDAYDVRITLYQEDTFSFGSELWFFSTPPEFKFSDYALNAEVPQFPAGASITYRFTAVGVVTSEYNLYGSASGGDERVDQLRNFQMVTISIIPGPGLITLEKPAYIIPEAGGGFVNVRRLGSADYSSAAVSFATSNGTAIAYSEFNPVFGRLEFRSGEETKTIYIPTINDPAPGCAKALTLHLFDAEGAFLVPYTNASITIADTPRFAGYVRPVSTDLQNVLNGTSTRLGSVSADGRKVAMVDWDTVDYDPDGNAISTSHIVLHDLLTRTWLRLSSESSPRGYSAPVLSSDGNVIAFQLGNYEQDHTLYSILARNLASTSNILVRAGGSNDTFQALTISSNGTLLAYEETSWDLYETHVFAYDFLTGSNELISVATNGSKANADSTLLALNTTGRYVVFQSWASDLVPNDTNGWPDVFLRDRFTGETELISLNDEGVGPRALASLGPASITPDGRYVLFVAAQRPTIPPEPGVYLTDIFVRDRVACVTRRVSIEPARTLGEWFNANFATMSDDGRYVAYHSFDVRSQSPDEKDDVVNVYLTDMQTCENTLITRNCAGTSGGNAPSYWPWISGDGAVVFFFSWASDLAAGEFWRGDTNLFRWERATKQTSVVTANNRGTGGLTGDHAIAGLSHDGRVLAFSSSATNLVFDDLNDRDDAFVWTAGERPALSIDRVNDQITLSWLATAPAVLECKSSDGDWMTAEGEVEISGDQNLYGFPIEQAPGARFFRLRLR